MSRGLEPLVVSGTQNHSTQDSCVVPPPWYWLTAQIGRGAVLLKSYGRGWENIFIDKYICQNLYKDPEIYKHLRIGVC